MIQSISREPFEIQVDELKMESFMELADFSNAILFIHPTISLFFDKLSMIRFNHNEILYSSHLNFFPWILLKVVSTKNIGPMIS